MLPFAQLVPKTFWNAPNDSAEIWIKIVLGLLVGIGIFVGLTKLPTYYRKYVLFIVTFGSGLFYVAFWLYPKPIGRLPDDAPRNMAESLSFWISDSQSVVADITNIVAAFLIGLGVYSLLRVHVGKVAKRQKDWHFSVVLLVSLVVMVAFGYADFIMRQNPANSKMAGAGFADWTFIQYGRDLLFDGLLQNMDAAMFSVVAFYILSAAYRAFRARSVEATIMLVTALLVMLSLMGLVEFFWGIGVDKLHLSDNFKLTEIAGWLNKNMQTPALRGIDFGVGIGLMAMGMRLWLRLEKTGGSS